MNRRLRALLLLAAFTLPAGIARADGYVQFGTLSAYCIIRPTGNVLTSIDSQGVSRSDTPTVASADTKKAIRKVKQIKTRLRNNLAEAEKPKRKKLIRDKIAATNTVLSTLVDLQDFVSKCGSGQLDSLAIPFPAVPTPRPSGFPGGGKR